MGFERDVVKWSVLVVLMRQHLLCYEYDHVNRVHIHFRCADFMGLIVLFDCVFQRVVLLLFAKFAISQAEPCKTVMIPTLSAEIYIHVIVNIV